MKFLIAAFAITILAVPTGHAKKLIRAGGAVSGGAPTITFSAPSAFNYIYPITSGGTLWQQGVNFTGPILSNSAPWNAVNGGFYTFANTAGCLNWAQAYNANSIIVGPSQVTGSPTCAVTANYPGSTPVTQNFSLVGTQQTITSIGPTTFNFRTPSTTGYILGAPQVQLTGTQFQYAATFTQSAGVLSLGTGANCSDFSIDNLGLIRLVPGSFGPGTLTCTLTATTAAASNSPQTVTITATGVAASAGAQFTATDCNRNITISGSPGLTLSTASTNLSAGEICRANLPKYSGKWYFEVTTSGTIGAQQAIGLANNGNGRALIGGVNTTIRTPQVLGNDANSVGYNYTANGNSTLVYNAASILPRAYTSLPPITSGKTIGVAVDLDSDPPQAWVTPDVTATSGFGGGPQWNGNNTFSPTIPGSGPGNIGSAGGEFFLLPGYEVSPVYQFRANASPQSVTFNFGGSAFVGTPPAGYSSWNTAGGAIDVPGPLNAQTIDVANAPAWQASQTYVSGDRVVAGPGWASGSYVQGANLYLWALSAGSGGTSASSGNGPQTCGTPANYGGGFAGSIPSQWSGATTATDGGITWTCLTRIDYVTLTGAFLDTPTFWSSGGSYEDEQYVQNAGNVYFQSQSVPTPPNLCIASSSGPTGTPPPGTLIADGTCLWAYRGAITYSSQSNRWPLAIWPYNSGGGGDGSGITRTPEAQTHSDVNLNIWYGGLARQLYQAGKNGENDPLQMANHAAATGPDVSGACYRGYTMDNTVTNGLNCNGPVDNPMFTSFNNLGSTFTTTLNAVPGDSFADNMNPASTPLAVNSAMGVEIYSNTPWVDAGLYPNPANRGTPLEIGEWGWVIQRLQMESVFGPVINTFAQQIFGDLSVNTIKDSIIDGAGNGLIASGAADNNFLNDVMIYHGAASATKAAYAIFEKYPFQASNNTIISSPPCTGCAAFQFELRSIGIWAPDVRLGPPPWSNNVFIGWDNLSACDSTAAIAQGCQSFANAIGNATDLPASYTGGASINDTHGNVITASPMYGIGNTCGPPTNTSSCFSLPSGANATFVNRTYGPSLDLRIPPTSPLYGAGANYHFPTFAGFFGTLVPGPDLLGTTRPQAHGYDIGAFEHP